MARGIGGGEERSVQGFGGETEGKSPLGKSKPRWEDNTKMDVQEEEWEWGLGMNDLGQNRDNWKNL